MASPHSEVMKMHVDIRATNLELEEEDKRVGERRVQFAFSRFAPRIRKVSIVLSDLNGPRGGHDTQCRVQVDGDDGWKLIVTDVDEDAARAMTFAITRAGRTVARRLDRRRDTPRRRPRSARG